MKSKNLIALVFALMVMAFIAPNVFAAPGDDIKITYYSNDLHDNANSDDEYSQITLSSANDVTIINLNSSLNDLRYDGNADGDLKDSPEDYALYDGVYVVDSAAGDVQLIYRPRVDTTYNRNGQATYIEDAFEGEVIKIKGTKYVLTESDEADGQDIEIGPAITKTLSTATLDPDNAAVATGTLKLLFDGTRLAMYDGNSLLDLVDVSGVNDGPYKLTSVEKTSDEFAPYDVYVMNETASQIKVSMVEKSQKFKITNGEEGVLGYSQVKVFDTDFPTTNVTFLDDTITMVKGDSVDVPDTYYQLKFTTAKGFDIQRKKESAVIDGAQLKTNTTPGKDFLTAEINLSAAANGVNVSWANGSQVVSDGATLNYLTSPGLNFMAPGAEIILKMLELPDATLYSNDISFSGTRVEGNNITISVNITNLEKNTTQNFTVAFYDGGPPNLIGETNTTLGATASVVWNATSGYHNILVIVDLYDVINESNETNNNISRSINISSSPVAASDIRIIHSAQDLHDDTSTGDEYSSITFSSALDNTIINLNSSLDLRYDGNADGDLKDTPEDYTIYNGLYIVDGNGGEVQPLYQPIIDTTYRRNAETTGIENAYEGETIKIKGTRYVITDNVTTEGSIELGPAIVKSISTSAVDPDNAVVVTRTLKMLYDGTNLLMYDRNSLLDIVDVSNVGAGPHKLTSIEKTSDEFAPYDVYVMNETSSKIKVSMVEKSRKFEVSDNQELVLGYASVKVGNANFPTMNVTFIGGTISMIKGDNVDLPDTNYQLKFTSAKSFDILRKKVSTVSSGTKLKSTTVPGKDFLDSGAIIVLTTVGGDVGGDINIEFRSDDLHDNANSDDEYAQITLNSTFNGTILNLNSSNDLRYDGNSDGDLKDSWEDYTLYDGVYIIDGYNGDVQPLYRPALDSTYKVDGSYIEDANAGEVVKIMGDKYVLTDTDTSDGDFEIGPAIVKTLTNTTVNHTNAAVMTGTLKMLFSSGKLYMYNGSTLLNEPVITGKASYPYKLTAADKNSSEFAPYDVYVINHTSTNAKISMVENSQKFIISNGEEGVLGYATVTVNNTNFTTTNVTFLGDVISMVRGESVDIADTYYQLKFTTARVFDIQRKKESGVVSGATIKSTVAPGKDFLATGERVTLALDTKPDLYINSYNLGFSNSNPVKGEPVVISAKASNLESQTSNYFTLDFYADSDMIGRVWTYEGLTENITWTPSSNGTYTIKVVVDGDNRITEASEVNNFVTRDITVKTGNIQIEFESQRLHDGAEGNDNYNATILSSADDNTLLSLTRFPTNATELRFDGNADNDLKDTEDYVVYNSIYVINGSEGDIQLLYQPTIDPIYKRNAETTGIGDAYNGEVIIIRGTRYVLTDNNTLDGDFEIGPAITKTLTAMTVDPDNAVLMTGSLKILYDGTFLRMYDNKSLLDVVSVSSVNDGPHMLEAFEKTSNEYAPYDVYVMNETASQIKVVMVEKSQTLKVIDNQRGQTDITVEFGSNQLHDGTSGEDFTSTILSSGNDSTIIPLTSSNDLRYDGNADGDLKDIEDYTLYEGVHVTDGDTGNVELIYRPPLDSTYKIDGSYIEDASAGEVVKIRGTRYVLTESNTSDGEIEMGPAIVKTLSHTTVDPDNAAVVTGTLKMLYNGTAQALYMYDGNSLLEIVDLTGKAAPYRLSSTEKTNEQFAPYDVYAINWTAGVSGMLRVSVVEKAQKFKVTDHIRSATDITVEFGSNQLHDDTSGEDFTSTILSSGNDSTIIPLSSSNNLRYDGNADNDLDDQEDYTLYDGIYVVNGNTGNVQMVYRPTVDPIYKRNAATNSIEDAYNGEVIIIRGSKYVLTDNTIVDGDFEIGPAITKTLTAMPLDSDNAFLMTGSLKMHYDGTTLRMYDGNIMLDSASVSSVNDGPYKLGPSEKTSDEYAPYDVYVMNETATAIKVAMVEKSQKFTIRDYGMSGITITVEFGSNQLHDGTSGEDFNSTTLNSSYDSTIIPLTSSNDLRYDGNADGDLKDNPEDYVLYDGVYVIDSASGDIQLMYRPMLDSTYKIDGSYIEDAGTGEVVKIKGSKYVLTDNDTSDGDFEMGPALVKTLAHTTVDPDNAVVVTGTLKLLYKGTDEALYMYDGNSLLDIVDLTGKTQPYKLSASDKTSDEYAPYDVYAINWTAGASGVLKVSMVQKSQKFTVTNDEEGVLGYSSVKVNDSDFVDRNVYFRSDVISMVKGTKIDVPDTYYQLRFTNSKEFDILRKKLASVADGTQLSNISNPKIDSLNQTINITVDGSNISIAYGSGNVTTIANNTVLYSNTSPGSAFLSAAENINVFFYPVNNQSNSDLVNYTTNVTFLSDTISMVKGGKVDVPDTNYELKFTNSKEFDILRKKTVRVSNGTTLSGSSNPKIDSLNQSINLTVAGSGTSVEYGSGSVATVANNTILYSNSSPGKQGIQKATRAS
jgi:hypothetical protein